MFTTFVFFAAVAVALAEAAYRIRPGDALRIAVLRHPEYAQEMTVQSDGRISYFLIGEINAAGKTPAELQSDIQRALAPQLKDAQVVVAPTPREDEVYVGGEVANPNRYTYREPELDARRGLVLAGGVRAESADLRRVTLLRRGAESVVVDLTGSDDVAIASGDALIVGRRVSIRVAGNVQKPDVYWVDEPVAAGYALALAGGIVEDKGSLTTLAVLRSDGSTETIPLDEQFWQDVAEQPRLSDGDTLYVPNAYRVEEISVLGYVHNPGLFRVRGPVPVGRALALAGGAILESADTRHAEILRLDGSRIIVDLDAAATTALVHPGDTVRISKRFAINWSFVVSLISTAAVIYSLVRQ
jgi:polysaccharide export outer membrane protein